MLVRIRRSTNFEEIISLYNEAKENSEKVIKSVSSLAENLYSLAHKLGDRHGKKEDTPEPSLGLAILFIDSCVTIGNLLVYVFKKGILKPKTNA